MDATSLIGDVLRILQSLGVVPPWAVYLTALLVAVALVLAQHFRPWAMIVRGLRRWAEIAKPEPEWDPEKGTGNLAPPMDMPPGGIPVPRKEWKDGEP